MNDNLINVRIVVAVSQDGTWYAVGNSGSTDDDTVAFLRRNALTPVVDMHFVEADIPAPSPLPVVAGALVPV